MDMIEFGTVETTYTEWRNKMSEFTENVEKINVTSSFISGYYFIELYNINPNLEKGYNIIKNNIDRKVKNSIIEKTDLNSIFKSAGINIKTNNSNRNVFITFNEQEGLPIYQYVSRCKKEWEKHTIHSDFDMLYWTTAPDCKNVQYCCMFRNMALCGSHNINDIYESNDVCENNRVPIELGFTFRSKDVYECDGLKTIEQIIEDNNI